MIILTIRSDNPQAEVGLYDDQVQVAYEVWQAHRQLAETIHQKIAALLDGANLTMQQLTGIVVFKGPGSFTGLRIGLSVGNAFAYSYSIPIVATMDDDWRERGIERLLRQENEVVAVPEYGSLPNITAPKH